MDNHARYNDPSVVSHYAAASQLMPPERYVFGRYVQTGMAILDIGVGGGRTTAHLAPMAKRYLGIDYATHMVEACRKRFPDLEFSVSDATDLAGIGDCEFDLTIFSFNGIDSLPTDAARRKALAEMRRVTKPGGHIIFSSHNARQLALLPTLEGATPLQVCWRVLRAIALTVQKLAMTLPSQPYRQGHGYVIDRVHGGLRNHVSTDASIAADCAAAGLQIVEAVGAFHPKKVPEWANNWTTYVAVVQLD